MNTCPNCYQISLFNNISMNRHCSDSIKALDNINIINMEEGDLILVNGNIAIITFISNTSGQLSYKSISSGIYIHKFPISRVTALITKRGSLNFNKMKSLMSELT